MSVEEPKGPRLSVVRQPKGPDGTRGFKKAPAVKAAAAAVATVAEETNGYASSAEKAWLDLPGAFFLSGSRRFRRTRIWSFFLGGGDLFLISIAEK